MAMQNGAGKHWPEHQRETGVAGDCGFELETFRTILSLLRNPLGLQLHRIDSVVPNAINDVCFELLTLAKENSGEYDGWETQVVKAGDEPTDDAPQV